MTDKRIKYIENDNDLELKKQNLKLSSIFYKKAKEEKEKIIKRGNDLLENENKRILKDEINKIRF